MFNAGKWIAETSSNLSSFLSLQQLINNQDTLEFHVNKIEIKSAGSEDDDDSLKKAMGLTQGFESLLRDAEINNIREANQNYQKQMIVFITSLLDGIVLDFFQCIFTAHPMRAYEFVSDPDEKILRGKIDLKDVLECNSKDELISLLSSKAAINATRGKFRATLHSLETISNSKLDINLSKDLLFLVEQRNRIVHELLNCEVTDTEVKNGFDRLYDLINSLSAIAQNNGIDVNNPLRSESDV